MKQNKKAKICFVIYIAGFFLNFFLLWSVCEAKKDWTAQTILLVCVCVCVCVCVYLLILYHWTYPNQNHDNKPPNMCVCVCVCACVFKRLSITLNTVTDTNQNHHNQTPQKTSSRSVFIFLFMWSTTSILFIYLCFVCFFAFYVTDNLCWYTHIGSTGSCDTHRFNRFVWQNPKLNPNPLVSADFLGWQLTTNHHPPPPQKNPKKPHLGVWQGQFPSACKSLALCGTSLKIPCVFVRGVGAGEIRV